MIFKAQIPFFVLLIISSICNAQTKDTMFCKGESNHDILAFITGHQFESHLESDVLRNEFSLSLTDTTFELVGFRASWSDQISIYEAVIAGDVFSQKKDTYNLKKIQPTDYVAFDCITVKKAGKYYRIPSFVSYATTLDIAQQKRINKPVCYSTIKGFYSGDKVSHSAFQADHTIELSDTSYKILDFTVMWDDINDEKIHSVTYKGNRLLVNRDATSALLKKLIPGNTVTIENIKIEKAGKIYRATDIIMYIK
jgi:hypothetical protein